MITQNETLILGIGNTLLSDEGAGIHALNLFRSEYADIPNLTLLDGGTLSFTLASWIEAQGVDRAMGASSRRLVVGYVAAVGAPLAIALYGLFR